MANKRLILDVPEAVHSRLKAEAALAGLRLGTYCAAILEESSGLSPEPELVSVEINENEIPSKSLEELRKLSGGLAGSTSPGEKRLAALVNSEILRRFRI